MGRCPKSNLGYYAHEESQTNYHTPEPAPTPKNPGSRIDEKSHQMLPTPSPTPLSDERPDLGVVINPSDIKVTTPAVKRSAPKTSHIPTGKRAKTKGSGGVPSRPARSLATGEAPQDTASVLKRNANLMGFNKAFNSPQLSMPAKKPSNANATIPQQAVPVATTPEDAIVATRSALTNMKSSIGREDMASVERHLLVAMNTMWSLYDDHFASSENENVGRVVETAKGVADAHLLVIEKGRKMLGKGAPRSSMSGVEGDKRSSSEVKMASSAGPLTHPKDSKTITPPQITPARPPIQPQDIMKKQELQIEVLRNEMRRINNELSDSRKQNMGLMGKVASLNEEAEDDKSDAARKVAERAIGFLQEDKNLAAAEIVRLKNRLGVMSADAAKSASSRAAEASRMEGDKLTRQVASLKQQLHKAQLSIQSVAPISSLQIDQLRKEKTEAVGEIIVLKQKIRVVETMAANAKVTREREIGDSLQKEDGLTETIETLQSHLQTKDLAIQTAKSAQDSVIDAMRKQETRYIEEVNTLKKRLLESDNGTRIVCFGDRDLMRKKQDQAIEEIRDLKLQIEKTKLANDDCSAAIRWQEGHGSLIAQVLRIAKEGEGDVPGSELPTDLEDPKPNPEIVELNRTILKLKKRIEGQSLRLTALHIKTKDSIANATLVPRGRREGKMEELYNQCVTDLAPLFIDMKQANIARDRTIQRLTSEVASLKSRARDKQHFSNRFIEVTASQASTVDPFVSYLKQKSQGWTANASKREEMTLRLARERDVSERRMVEPGQEVLHQTKDTEKTESKGPGAAQNGTQKASRSRGQIGSHTEPGEMKESGESRKLASNAIYSLHLSTGKQGQRG